MAAISAFLWGKTTYVHKIVGAVRLMVAGFG
jgi:hypothetical protein